MGWYCGVKFEVIKGSDQSMAIKTNENFGGKWTVEKLEILTKYLKAYTTAMKKIKFTLAYVDAFAGSGELSYRSEDSLELLDDVEGFYQGSARLAIEIQDKPFDKLVFVEIDNERLKKLTDLRSRHTHRCIDVVNQDANEYIRSIDWMTPRHRGVLFLDPFGVEVAWATIEAIAGFEAFDTWILFPTSAISRLLNKTIIGDIMDHKFAPILTKIFRDERWKQLYEKSVSTDILSNVSQEVHTRSSGVEQILGLYKDRLRELFGNRFLENSRALYNSKNSRLFEFIFCAGSPSQRAIETSHRIAGHIIKKS